MIEEISQIFDNGVIPSVSASKEFVDEIKGRFFTGKNFEEVPESPGICRALGVERIRG